MDEPLFRRRVERMDRNAPSEGEDDAVEPLIHALAARELSESAAFAEILARLLHAPDGRRSADASRESEKHPEGSLCARCFVDARGEAHSRKVLADPTRMPRSDDEHCWKLTRPGSRSTS